MNYLKRFSVIGGCLVMCVIMLNVIRYAGRWHFTGFLVLSVIEIALVILLLWHVRRLLVDVLYEEEERVHNERLTALGEISAMVAHEVRNPMSSIKTCAQQLMDNSMDQEKRVKYAGYLLGEVDRLNAIVESILKFSREPRPEFRPCGLNELVRETYEFMRNECVHKEVSLNLDLEEALEETRVRVDAEHIKQILMNFIRNAVQAVGRADKKTITVITRQDNARITLSVADSGGGISPDIMGEIFKPFFTTTRQGCGLGLSICKQLADANNVAIAVENDWGAGAVFQLIFAKM